MQDVPVCTNPPDIRKKKSKLGSFLISCLICVNYRTTIFSLYCTQPYSYKLVNRYW